MEVANLRNHSEIKLDRYEKSMLMKVLYEFTLLTTNVELYEFANELRKELQ